MSVLMRRENTLIIEPGSDISKIQIINFILLPNSKKHFEGPPLQQMVSGMCQCPSGQSVVNDSCKQTSYVINITNFECSQEIYTQTFDIQSITNQLNSPNNFSSGYVFSASTIIQNAFVDISDNIYTSTVYPLFQSQSTFHNLKIQFGTQSLNDGSFVISTCTSISINQMNIISRSGSQLILNAGVLNILSSSLQSANINNLLVNLSFAPSHGNITLIRDINGIFNISGYTCLGSYVSSGTVAMIGLNSNFATVNVNLVNFRPTAFYTGNGSSYLFGNATTANTININNFSVIIGNITSFSLLASISTTSNITYYLFGGVIAQINSNSVINVNNIIFDSYQKFSTNYVSSSGFLVGQNKNSNYSSIIIKNICLQQNMISTTLEFYAFGLIGQNIGNSSIQNVSITISVQGIYFYDFGIIGYQYDNSKYAEVINLRTSVQFNITHCGGRHIGSLFGFENAQNCSVTNSSVVGSFISSNSTDCVGGFFGTQQQNATIINSSIYQINISGISIGGFVGNCVQPLYLIKSKIQFVRFTGSYIGIVAGYGSVYFTSSSSTQNYVNSILQSDCTVLSNQQTGC
ncbi:Hypothetical_protein [Hexamita inflata]|uniref:Hypothetical_protein n=1 Tax=Hexamita inflata TaxID=28002 RepID=A0AA86N7X2_9EUKA|nr:Hypothetical protein HINF_LOCUS2016 [Hexamita inflata]